MAIIEMNLIFYRRSRLLADKTHQIYTTLRGPDANWRDYLFPAIVYALTVTALYYFLTVLVLKKKRYV